jgi:putative ATP-binding cassette transporter
LTKQIKRPEQSHLLRRFWENATGFWGKRGPRLSWVLSAVLLLTILLNLATSYGMNLWTRGIFDALQERHSHTILLLSMIYLPLLASSVASSVLQVYTRMTTQRRWREWLTNQLGQRF